MMTTVLKLVTGYGRRLLLAGIGILLGCMPAHSGPSGVASLTRALTPNEATYLIDGQALTLRNGRVVVAPVAGTAVQTIIQVFGEPVRGDLDGDGVPDAALLLVVSSGGSGTFYYIAAAFDRDGVFVGSEALFLGDRIAPQQLSIRHGLVVANYAERLPGQAMTVPLSQGVSKYLVCRGDRLEEVLLAESEQISAGVVVIGHEVRSFTPCGAGQAVWLMGNSPALPAIKASYQLAMADTPAYTPLFMVLTGRPVDSPREGFGADYPSAFHATQLVFSRSGEACGSQ